MALTQKQLDLIETTWSFVKQDLQASGNIMFFKLFEISPQLLNKFPFCDSPIDQLEENESFNKHSLGVMETIDAAVGLLKEKKVEDLQDILLELGMAHVVKNVTKEDFQPVGQALLYTLSTVAGNKFTAEAKEVWLAVYTFVQDKMGEGMDEIDEM